jgi:hypothetical protein
MNGQGERTALADRLRRVRLDLFGEHGAPELAGRLGIPTGTWLAYEAGRLLPAMILVRLVEATSVNPVWLLSGEGPMRRESAGPHPSGDRSL